MAKTPEKKAAPEATQGANPPRAGAAEWAYERLILYIQNFEEQLDNTHEVAIGFTGTDAGVLRIEGIGFYAPDIVTFYGADQHGTKTQLIQHVSQLNVMLRALPRENDSQEPTRIGFRLASTLKAAQQEAPQEMPEAAPEPAEGA